MNKENKSKKAFLIFILTLIGVVAIFVVCLIKNSSYNNTSHNETFTGEEAFSSEADATKDVAVNVVARGDTWGKIFDFNNEGLTENNYKAYTYDSTVSNNTSDTVTDFRLKMNFSNEAYLASGWNGSFEIHQNVNNNEVVALVPDMREFKASDYPLETYELNGEYFVKIYKGDYLIYIPSSSRNAPEIPIAPEKATTPGMIMYVANGQSVEDSAIELEYKLHRALTSEALFWVAIAGFTIWLIILIVYLVIKSQIRKYQERHERDNEIINESIETFTGFIDAKDPYTHGHSKRVAIYTRQIAKELGYEGEELDRIYYVALLHDCGKIGVPDNVLGKPGKLTDEEFEIIKSHTVRGSEILCSFKSLDNVGEGALYHHERYDGRGYPEGKAGEDIPLIARIICVADSFDAMNTNRVYRDKLSKEYILSELEKNKGTQFDPKIADIMIRLIKEGKIQ